MIATTKHQGKGEKILTKREITYRAEDIGFFNKTVSVFCNTDTSPVIIKLKGTVKR